ncbi:MAG: hypothetical protein AB7O21_03410 [Gammaproteobacteria bacterium]
MPNAPSIVTNVNVQDYFHAQLEASLAHQQVLLDLGTVHYLARLLTEFSNPHQLFERSADGLDLKPLALHYAEAVHAEGARQRNVALKRLGDIALFISGMFAGSLSRKVVNIDYYAAMGGAAYRDLHAQLAASFGEVNAPTPFAELASKFLALIDVLAEVAEESHLGVKPDLLRDYETWLRTGSPRAQLKLRRAGVVPSRAATSLAHH